MEKQLIAQKTHNQSQKLTTNNSIYKKELYRFGILSILQDLAPNKKDITSKLIFKTKPANAKGLIYAKQQGIISGISEIIWIINEYCRVYHTEIKIETFIKDGEKAEIKKNLILLNGPINHLLIIERTILNILQRMSGISTKTAEISTKVKKINPEILITTTRKTPYGLLDKKAAQTAGAGTHRLNLSDAVLIKDTHLDFFNRNISEVLNKVLKTTNFGKFAEIEVQNEEEARVAAQTFNENRHIGTILLDNFSPEKIKNCVNQLKKHNLFNKVILEVSGGITEDNIEEYVKNEINIISLGFLTHSVQALDLAMKIKKK